MRLSSPQFYGAPFCSVPYTDILRSIQFMKDAEPIAYSAKDLAHWPYAVCTGNDLFLKI